MRVLVVDDDPLTRIFLRRYFSQRYNCDVIEAANGLEGLSRIEELTPDLVILDLTMPILDGVECLEIIRRDRTHRHLPIIVLTAHTEKERVQRLLELGISDFLLKPLDTKDAQMRITRVIDEINAEREAHQSNFKTVSGDLLRPSVLMVDGEKSFRIYFRSLFAERYDITLARNGMEALEQCSQGLPDIVCIGEGLPLITQDVLAARLRRQDVNNETVLLSCIEQEPADPAFRAMIDGWVKRSTIPEMFTQDLDSAIHSQRYSYNKIRKILRHYVIREFLSSTQKVMDVSDMHILENREVEARDLTILGTVDIVDPGKTFVVHLGLQGAELDVLRFVGRVIDHAPGLRRTRVDAIRELVRQMGERVQGLLRNHGVVTDVEPASVVVLNESSKCMNWTFAVAMKLQSSERYVLGMGIEQVVPAQIEEANVAIAD